MSIILMWLAVFCFIGFIIGLFGVLVPGRQWWRKGRSRAAQVMGGSFAAFIIFATIAGNTVPQRSDVLKSSTSQTSDFSRDSVPTTKIVQKETEFGTIILRQDVPPGSSLQVIARRHGDTVMVQFDTNLPKNTIVSVSVGREYYEVGNPETYSQEYFSERGTIADWSLARTIPVNNEKWKKELRQHQAKMAKISSSLAFEIDRIEDDVTVSVIVPRTEGLNRESRVPYPLGAMPEPLVTQQQASPPAVSTPPILSEDIYRQEFRQYVVRPCYESHLKNQELSEALTVEEFITFMKETGKYDSMQTAEDQAVLRVKGQSKEVRMSFYILADLTCRNPEQLQ